MPVLYIKKNQGHAKRKKQCPVEHAPPRQITEKKDKKNLKISNRSETGLTAPVPGFPVEPAGFYCFAVFILFTVF